MRTRVNGGSLSSAGLRVGTPDDEGGLEITNGGVTTSTNGYIDGSDDGDPFSTGFDSQVIVSGPDSKWIVTNDLRLSTEGPCCLATGSSGAALLNIRDGGLVSVGERLIIFEEGVVNLDGGTLRFNTFGGLFSGTFNFNAGTIQLTGNRSIGADEDIADILGIAPTVTSGKGLTVEGTATLLTTLTLDGGTFTANALAGGNYLQLYRGTLNIMNQAVTIGAGGVLGSALDVNEDMTVNVTLGITNQGLVAGDGEIGGTFANAAAGELRAQAGRSLRLTGANNTNAGQIKLFGGELEYTQSLTNNVGGFISGNGSLIVRGGLVNQGTMNFAGTANIDGAVTNAAGGKIISGGGGATIFYDDVTNNGEIRTSTNGFTVFFGSVSGSGTFTGTGTVNFEGDLSPGSSPATVNFGGDVAFGPDSTLQIELGGTTPGTQYDQINVAGELTLDGTLRISLINGFTPTAGQSFDFFNVGTIAGTFSAIELPSLEGLAWNTSQLAAGILSVTLPGDFNINGIVDAADYTVWRDGLGTIYTQSDYDVWKAHFGESLDAGNGAAGYPLGASAASLSPAVPEPTTGLLVFLGLAVWSWIACNYPLRVPSARQRVECFVNPPISTRLGSTVLIC